MVESGRQRFPPIRFSRIIVSVKVNSHLQDRKTEELNYWNIASFTINLAARSSAKIFNFAVYIRE